MTLRGSGPSLRPTPKPPGVSYVQVSVVYIRNIMPLERHYPAGGPRPFGTGLCRTSPLRRSRKFVVASNPSSAVPSTRQQCNYRISQLEMMFYTEYLIDVRVARKERCSAGEVRA